MGKLGHGCAGIVSGRKSWTRHKNQHHSCATPLSCESSQGQRRWKRWWWRRSELHPMSLWFHSRLHYSLVCDIPHLFLIVALTPIISAHVFCEVTLLLYLDNDFKHCWFRPSHAWSYGCRRTKANLAPCAGLWCYFNMLWYNSKLSLAELE